MLNGPKTQNCKPFRIFSGQTAANGGMPPCRSGKQRSSAMQERKTAEFRHARAENSGIPLSAILRQILHILFY
jgi:hypothetical protein